VKLWARVRCLVFFDSQSSKVVKKPLACDNIRKWRLYNLYNFIIHSHQTTRVFIATYIILSVSAFAASVIWRAPLLQASMRNKYFVRNNDERYIQPQSQRHCAEKHVAHQRAFYSHDDNNHYRFPVSESTEEIFFERQHAETRRLHRVQQYSRSTTLILLHSYFYSIPLR